MRFDQLLGNRQPESSPSYLAMRPEGLEQPAQHLGRNPGAVIGDQYFDAGRRWPGADRHRRSRMALHGLGRVPRQVPQDAGHAFRVECELQLGGRLDLQGHAQRLQFHAQQPQMLAQQTGERPPHGFDLNLAPAELEAVIQEIQGHGQGFVDQLQLLLASQVPPEARAAMIRATAGRWPAAPANHG